MRFIAIVLIAVTLISGQDSTRRISSIIISGNAKTKNEVILRELLFRTGDSVNDSMLTASKNRLENLFLFNRVEFRELPDSASVTLLIEVTERLFIFPYPHLAIEDRDWDKITYGLGFAHGNFRGRNEKLYGEAYFGYKPGFKLGYYNPWLGKQLHLTSGFYIKRYSSSHRTLDFDERHLSLDFVFGKYWTLNFYSLMNLSFDEIEVPEAYKTFMLTGTSKDRITALLFQTALDTRDLYAYPHRGLFYRFIYAKHGLFEHSVDYSQYSIDLNQYYTVSRITLASRLHLLQTIGELPFYRVIYFGFLERIRGHFHDVYEGRHRFLASGEIRFPLTDIWYFDLPSMIIPPSSTKNLKFGINGALFMDTGMVWHKKNQFGVSNFLSGFGAGLHFLLPYVEVARLEMAFDSDYNHQYIFEVGVVF